MNGKEFQEWLEQFPEDAVIEVCVGHDAGGYYHDTVVFEQEFEGTRFHDYDFVDFTQNPHTKPTDVWFGKKLLTLGQDIS